MSVQRLDTCFVLVVPNLHESIIGTGDQVRLVSTGVVVHTVDSLLVTFKSEVRLVRTELPHFESAIERGRAERIRVFSVEYDLAVELQSKAESSYLHDVMCVSLENLLALPLLFPVPKFNKHIVRRGKNEWLRRMNCNASE